MEKYRVNTRDTRTLSEENSLLFSSDDRPKDDHVRFTFHASVRVTSKAFFSSGTVSWRPCYMVLDVADPRVRYFGKQEHYSTGSAAALGNCAIQSDSEFAAAGAEQVGEKRRFMFWFKLSLVTPPTHFAASSAEERARALHALAAMRRAVMPSVFADSIFEGNLTALSDDVVNTAAAESSKRRASKQPVDKNGPPAASTDHVDRVMCEHLPPSPLCCNSCVFHLCLWL
jgi:hypothetical protein